MAEYGRGGPALDRCAAVIIVRHYEVRAVLEPQALPAVVAHSPVEPYPAVIRGAPFKFREVSDHGDLGRRIGYPKAAKVRPAGPQAQIV